MIGIAQGFFKVIDYRCNTERFIVAISEGVGVIGLEKKKRLPVL